MPARLTETRNDHRGEPLPEGVYALVDAQLTVVSYKSRWREEDEKGVERQRSKSFSPRRSGSLDKARAAAVDHREAALQIVRSGAAVQRTDKAGRQTLGQLFKEWITDYAAHNVSGRYATDCVKTWDNHVDPRLGNVRLAAISADPGIVVRFHDDLERANLAISARRAALKLLRTVLRWGRRRYPRALTTDFAGLFKLPSSKRKRLIRATDAVAIERIIEAISRRPHRDPLLPIRDAAFVAAMAYTVAARPSEWLYSATWAGVRSKTVELEMVQNALGEDSNYEVGLKTGARATIFLPNGHDRVMAYRQAVEARYGPQPENALVFQVLGDDGPQWDDNGFPVAWSVDRYNRWLSRVWRPARAAAANAPDTEKWIDNLTFYELRHTAISMALHSTLVMTKDGMNLHNLASWSGHDVLTLQRYYAHQIARYRDADPIDLETATLAARQQVASTRSECDWPRPQRDAQQRRRARRLRTRRSQASAT